MKLYRNAIILVVVLGLLVGAYFFINYKKSGTTDPASQTTDTAKSIKVMEMDSEKITSIEYSTPQGKFSIKKKGDTWVMDPAFELALDKNTVDNTISSLADVEANKIVSENSERLSDFGLDKPSVVKVVLSDGTSKELEVGNKSPTGEDVYVKVKGQPKIYTVGGYYEDMIKVTRGHFASKQILPVEAVAIKKFEYKKDGQVQYSIDIDSEADMKIVAPIKEEADTTKISQLVEKVVQMEIRDIIEEKPADLAKYGLDDPRYEVTYADKKTSKTVLLGDKVGAEAEASDLSTNGNVLYAKFSNANIVFTIDVSNLTFLDVSLKDVISPFVCIPNINDVSKVELSIDGKTTVSEIHTVEGKKEEEKFKVDGKDANMKDSNDKSLFKAFYQAMIGITFNKYQADLKPQGTPEITIKYHMKKDNKVVTVDFIPKDSNYYYAVKDGVYTNRLVLKNKFDEPEGVRETLKNLQEAIAKAK
ncbi:DUF4340 domain-containing protein [Ruminiclostridium josui]|uniref:DUF4340 domain-containing protein n=1 Tax=Ruminiclostridium josui TaxID=1499 RepID=UPI00046358D7|nr:DUF4340 domain-containing protein [Ruminiclostridium josui]